MTTFEDGPAKGQRLMLKGSPKFLRVVLGRDKWDALDRPEDSPESGERIFAYRLKEHLGNYHICKRGGGGGFYPICVYQFIPDQPLEDSMRERSKWGAWCDCQPNHETTNENQNKNPGKS